MEPMELDVWVEEWRRDVSPRIASGDFLGARPIMARLAGRENRPKGVVFPPDIMVDANKMLKYNVIEEAQFEGAWRETVGRHVANSDWDSAVTSVIKLDRRFADQNWANFADLARFVTEKVRTDLRAIGANRPNWKRDYAEKSRNNPAVDVY
jgi:hypothetical protein